jgi:hypothetical protein
MTQTLYAHMNKIFKKEYLFLAFKTNLFWRMFLLGEKWLMCLYIYIVLKFSVYASPKY